MVIEDGKYSVDPENLRFGVCELVWIQPNPILHSGRASLDKYKK